MLLIIQLWWKKQEIKLSLYHKDHHIGQTRAKHSSENHRQEHVAGAAVCADSTFLLDERSFENTRPVYSFSDVFLGENKIIMMTIIIIMIIMTVFVLQFPGI